MKKCPFCKADIEDQARFCLYCMKPLNEKQVISPPKKKKQWWTLAMAVVLLSVLLGLTLLLQKESKTALGGTAGEAASSGMKNSQGETHTQDTDAKDSPQAPGTNAAPEQESGSAAPNPSQVPPAAEPSEPQEPTTDRVTAPPTTEPETQPEETTLPTQPEEPTEETTAATTDRPSATAVYNYRAARAGDDFEAQYANPGNHIVITGIEQQSENGVYNIPEYIDGQRVIAITANAFYGSNVRVVYLPPSLRTIWNYAFNGCALTDIYFTKNTYIESMAFYNNTCNVTIHCPKNCHNRAFWYYSSGDASEGMYWAEWNG